MFEGFGRERSETITGIDGCMFVHIGSHLKRATSKDHASAEAPVRLSRTVLAETGIWLGKTFVHLSAAPTAQVQ
jgi:hypothetical protein